MPSGRTPISPDGKRKDYTTLTVGVPKPEGDLIKAKAKAAGKSVSRYLADLAINDRQEAKND